MKHPYFFITLFIVTLSSPHSGGVPIAVASSGLYPASELIAQERTDEAITFLQSFCELNKEKPDAAPCAYLLGTTLITQKKWEEAATWLERSLADKTFKPLRDYALYHLGRARLETKEYEAAATLFQEILDKHPQSRWSDEALFQSGKALASLERRKESSSLLEKFVASYRSSPLASEALMLIAKNHEAEGKTQEATENYKELWIRYPVSKEATEAAEKLFKPEHRSEGKAIPISRDDRVTRATRLVNLGHNDKAGSELEGLIKDLGAEDDGRVALLLGKAYFGAREYNSAQAALGRISEDNASGDITQEAAFMRARALQRAGKRTEAARTYAMIRKKYPASDYAIRAGYNLADMAESDGETQKALALYREINTDFPKSGLADNALWNEGWLLYLSGEYSKAVATFAELIERYPSSSLADAALYWSARAADRGGMPDKAAAQYRRVIKGFPLSYYAFLAGKRAAPSASSEKEETAPASPPAEPKFSEKTAYHLDKGTALTELGLNSDAAAELYLAEKGCKDKEARLELAKYASAAGYYYGAQRIVYSSFYGDLASDPGKTRSDVWRLAFPLGYPSDVLINAEKNALNPSLILAVIKEESTYRPDIVSSAGAIGLMQIMPATGKKLSREVDMTDFKAALLFKEEINIALGSRYLKHLVNATGGRLPLAVASYNAGPNRVAEWIERYGTDDLEEFVEKIPYTETRNYVKKVMRSYGIYEELYTRGLRQVGNDNLSVTVTPQDTRSGS
ncbi:MAG: tetratricopeptide repeat protein [Nitrospirota bacterium]|nr:tetratricopeptide repeat protein [Nitrospirota bacterium]